ncbi:hypothetical protein ACFWPH_28315 [Nocardia sp. NPDC058499]|uniref:hypothetical protein n=1 Tax=Nocardia sp. NPDC058499 TaxID=3346530 RepID=UPI00365D67FB
MSEYFKLPQADTARADDLTYRHFHTTVDGATSIVIEDRPGIPTTPRPHADLSTPAVVDDLVEMAHGTLRLPVRVRATVCTLPSCLVYCDDAGCREMVAAQPGGRCPRCRSSELVPWAECGWLDIDAGQRWRYDYEQIVACIYSDEQREIRIGRYHARVIARAWANPHDYPELDRWADGATDCEPEILRAEAETLSGSLVRCTDFWKHDGRAQPQLAAAFALANYLTDLAYPPA